MSAVTNRIPELAGDRSLSIGRAAWIRFRRNPSAIAGAAIIALFVLVALLAPWLTPYQPGSAQWSDQVTLDHVPARLRVIRICRPRYGCRACGTIHQAPAPERTIAKGLATPALLAHVLVSKYCDHLPLYRQSQIFARQGVELDRSTLANWIGGACWWLEPLQVPAMSAKASRSRSMSGA